MKKILLTSGLALLFMGYTVAQQTRPINGTHDVRHSYYAFTHAHIFEDYQTSLDDATLLVKDGAIVDIGTNIAIPQGAVIYDCKGKTIYPSFIDLYSGYGMPAPQPKKYGGTQLFSNTPGAYAANQAIKSQTNAEDVFHASPVDAAPYRNLGFGVVLTSQHDGIAQGSYALVTLADTNDNEAILEGKAAAGYSLNKGTSTEDLPTSLMGAIGVLRQDLLRCRMVQSF